MLKGKPNGRCSSINPTFHLRGILRGRKKSSGRNPMRAVLITIEFIITISICSFICVIGMVNMLLISGVLKLFCDIQSGCCFASFFIFPLLIVLSLWRRILSITKYYFLLIGILCILSGIIAFSVACLEYSTYTYNFYHKTWHILLIPVWGVGCVIRYWCCIKYGSAFYFESLLISHKKSTQDFHILLTILLLYATMHILFLLIFIIL